MTFITFTAIQIATIKKRPMVKDTVAAFSAGFIAAVLVGVVVAVAATATFSMFLPIMQEKSSVSEFTFALFVFVLFAIAILNLAFAITFRWTIKFLDSSK